MQCCANCFVSQTLKDHIDTENTVGDCDFCSSKNVKCLKVSDLHELFEPIFGLYREIEYGRDYFKDDDPIDHGELLPRLIEEDWHPIFSEDFNEDMLDDFWDFMFDEINIIELCLKLDELESNLNYNGVNILKRWRSKNGL